MAKDAGYKIVAHMMPDLPNCGVERDIWQFQEFFENPAFRSDGLKLYPTLVIRGTGELIVDIGAKSRFIRIMAYGQVQELPTKRSGRYRSENHGSRASLDPSLPCAAVRPAYSPI